MTPREELEDLLRLLADFDAQRRYQADVPRVNVPAELFNQWDDLFRLQRRVEFTESEWAAVETFAVELDRIASETPNDLPPLEVCIRSVHWQALQAGATMALARLGMSRA